MRIKRHCLLALCSATVVAGSGHATENTDEADLRAQIDRLNQRIGQLEAQTRGDDWLTEARAAEIRSLVQDVLADADTRASLLQGGGTAGHDGHFFLADADGNYRLELAGQVQVRYVFNYQDDGDDGEGDIDTTRQGFEVRRNKLNFSGHVFDPTWMYEVQGGFERDGGAFVLEVAMITKDLENGWSLNFGQFKPRFMWEENTSSKRQLAVDRSLVNEEFNQDYGQGIELAYQGEQFGFSVMYHDGFGSDNMGALVYDTEWGALTARADLLIAGGWRQFRDFTSPRDEEFGFRIGAAAHYEVMEYGTPVGPEEELFTWTADAQAEFGGFNLFGAIVGRHLEEADMDQFGAVIQGGVYITDNDEIFGRFEWSDYDASGVEDLLVLTVGWNHYFDGHALKWTTDVGYAFDEVASPFATSGAGWRADTADNDGQLVVRSQFQLLW